VAKARRGRRRGREPQRADGGSRPREHWREDGSPKTRYPSRDDANRAALERLLEDRADLDPYPCSICGSWHLGGRRE